MFKVFYVKFYQAVQIGPDGHSFLGGAMPKIRGAEMVYQNGLLTIKSPSFKTVHVPFSNIMFMHELEEEVKPVAKAKK